MAPSHSRRRGIGIDWIDFKLPLVAEVGMGNYVCMAETGIRESISKSG